MLKNRLKEIRMKEHLMNQQEFAVFIEIERRLYNRYENSRVCPSLETALKIAKKLDKHVDDIWSSE